MIGRSIFKLLSEASRFPCQQVEITVTLQCSGTRRIEQIQEYPGDGDELINAPWGEGAIGTAVYCRVSLKKVLKFACGGLKPEGKHLEFLGADTYFKKGDAYNYAVSVSTRKMRNQGGEEVILAWEMDGKPLPKIHGFPLRAVVTGIIGACRGSGFTRSTRLRNRAEALCRARSMCLHYTNQGWAYSGGGNWPERVEVSPETALPRAWRLSVPIDAEDWAEFCVRTWDSSCNTEPTFVRSAQNWDLRVTSSCHRIKLYSMNRTKPETKARLEAFAARGESITPVTRPTAFGLGDMNE
ncbi:molybdopterin binding oxidoreductase [Daedalea quercina L-15889]|uniref:Molybdopterin binding oxidoreductase n=1 Tax=Daedalea quercina L-15889 TaxID=1314783 RepID=A0A165MLQ5_9APHY|nr:molybdopterin binding oxidoreductase [Daedalea quercina L-15889]